MKYNILLFKKDEKKKMKKKRNGAQFRLYYYFFFSLVPISYSYYLIIENMALQAPWPADPTDLLQPNLTP